jgi:hypothetical protein
VAHRPGSLLALLAVAALAARCGGDGSDQSKAEYVRKANAVCSESNERVRALAALRPAERAATDYGLGECARLGLVVR